MFKLFCCVGFIIMILGCATGEKKFDEIMMDKVKKKAAYDFDCEKDHIRVNKIDSGSYGAKGCGKKASYVGASPQICNSLNSPRNLINHCQVVPDTFQREQPNK